MSENIYKDSLNTIEGMISKEIEFINTMEVFKNQYIKMGKSWFSIIFGIKYNHEIEEIQKIINESKELLTHYEQRLKEYKEASDEFEKNNWLKK